VGSFDWARDTAGELIEEFGVAATLRQVGQDTPVDENKPWVVSPATVVDISVTACFISSVGESLQYSVNGQTLTGKMLGLVAAPGTTPQVGNQLFATGGTVWTVVSVKEHAPDAVPIMWEMVLDL